MYDSTRARGQCFFSSSRSAFTLIELLVAIALIAILAVVIVLALNPAQLLAQSRDANRLSDMATFKSVIDLYNTDQLGSVGYSLGNASSVYISLSDPSSVCGAWNLPALSTGYTYACSLATSSRLTDSSGWIPVNLSSMTSGSPMSNLPIDPTNSSSSGLYYSYYTNGSQFEVTSLFESQKYKSQYGQTPVDPSYPEINAAGSSLSINPIFNPMGLVGWWSMDEGSGSSTIDQSGNGNNGAWHGTAAGISGYYSPGKVGNWAGAFNLAASNQITIPISNTAILPSSAITVSTWVNTSADANFGNLLQTNPWGSAAGQWQLMIYGGGIFWGICSGTTCTSQNNVSYAMSTGIWHLVTGTYDGATVRLYVDGNQVSTRSLSGQTLYQASSITTAFNSTTTFSYLEDDVRVYNRALSPAEIRALYNAEK